MAKEIQDKENTTWSLIEAYAGLKSDSDDDAPNPAAKVKGNDDKVYVIATPSGGAQTVRLELPTDWETSLSDQQIFDEIKNHQQTDD